jgi:hypothetical protein
MAAYERGRTTARRPARTVALWAALLAVSPARAAEDDGSEGGEGEGDRKGGRFAVVNLAGPALPSVVLEEIERETARLRPGARPITDPAMRRILVTAEAPLDTVRRLANSAERLRDEGDCADAIPAAREAEDVALTSLSADEERDLLKRLYVTLVICEETIGRATERDAAARRLRALVSSRPETLPEELWGSFVANAEPQGPMTELQIDSEPANANVQINFRAVGVTPRTLQVPRGEILVEVEKQGFKKSFRRLEVGEAPARTVFRLTERGRDRIELATAALRALSSAEGGQLGERSRTLGQLSQWARADVLVVVRRRGDRVLLDVFDADRGALARDTIDSAFDPATGRVQMLAERASPTPSDPDNEPGILAPVGRSGRPLAVEGKPGGRVAGLGETYAPASKPRGRRVDPGPPWWSWLIAASVAGGIALAVLANRTTTSDTLDVRATWDPRGQ